MAALAACEFGWAAGVCGCAGAVNSVARIVPAVSHLALIIAAKNHYTAPCMQEASQPPYVKQKTALFTASR